MQHEIARAHFAHRQRKKAQKRAREQNKELYRMERVCTIERSDRSKEQTHHSLLSIP